MTATQSTRKSATGKAFSEEEQAAMRERAEEVKAERRRGGATSRADGERDVLAKLAEMPEADRAMGERIHAIVTASAPGLIPRTWYGMPAYAKEGKVLCFFQGAAKFKARYSTLGFNDAANLDDGAMWPTGFALEELTPEVEASITELVTRAAS